MKKSNTSFFYSSVILPENKRNALRIIYAYCRMTDDIADDINLSKDEKILKLNEWKNQLDLALQNKFDDNFFIQLKKYIDEFNIPHQPFYDLIKGMQMDITGQEYKNFDKLMEYCYYAASTVGLMTISIFGYTNDSVKEYAVNLGKAMQLTNILRDVYKDARLGRFYLPQDDLLKFGVTIEDIKNKVYNKNFIELMEYEFNRTKELYKKANEFLYKEDTKKLLPAKIMEKIYFRLLLKLKKRHYNVFDNNISLCKLHKIYIALSLFLKYKILYR